MRNKVLYSLRLLGESFHGLLNNPLVVLLNAILVALHVPMFFKGKQFFFSLKIELILKPQKQQPNWFTLKLQVPKPQKLPKHM